MIITRPGDICSESRGGILSNENIVIHYGEVRVTRRQAFDAVSYGWRVKGKYDDGTVLMVREPRRRSRAV